MFIIGDLINYNYCFPGSYYRVPGFMAMKEIYENGPITATFNMYEDFLNYQSGMDYDIFECYFLQFI